jgi:hypothetical protein
MHVTHYEADSGLVIIRYAGVIGLDDVRKGSREAVKLMAANNAMLAIVDTRDIDFRLSTLEIFDLPTTLSAIIAESGLELRKIRRALLVSTINEDFHFVETVALNRGYQVKLFEDEIEARQWLNN